ncbi:MAG TPA: glycogen debranching protein [Leeuwenhoekiella sp.]|nr:glycogen debranching protein [Leeuwenhoekiella sp.]HBO29513.1 glycogen debranching protein [Leeuwenhoekiella sp.]|tara:strand:+ start:1547 stop:3931 length:2385 start_codon:yes stop_codon:yes gene_type:complete
MRIILIAVLMLILGCTKTATPPSSFKTLAAKSPSIAGKTAYLASPFVTAGNRIYMVGHQDGSFPDLGWHIKGEMGGIWDHPIKLMDGFDLAVLHENDTLTLNNADRFVNYPFTNMHEFAWAEKNLNIQRWQFVPDDTEGIIIQLAIENTGDAKEVQLDFTGISDLRPTWLGDRTGMIDSKDQAVFDDQNKLWNVRDQNNPWHVLFGSSVKPTATAQTSTQDATTQSSLSHTLQLPAASTTVFTYYIAGSYQSKAAALATYKKMLEQSTDLFQAKKERYEQLASHSKLSIPDISIAQAFEWLKYNSDWLVRRVPEVGTGISAGIPDYPWWFGVDSEYALKGLMAIGQTETVYSSIRLLDSLSKATNGNGRIVHEVSTNGAVFNPGNINETPQFASLIWEVYRWNGDRKFLETYYPSIKKGMHWLLTEKDTDQNLFPDGYGMMEIHGLDSEMIDVASYTQRALVDAAKIAEVLKDTAAAENYKAKAAVLKEQINTQFWSETFNSYADFIGTDAQALHLIEDAIVRADTLEKPWAVKELKETRVYIKNNPSTVTRPFVLYHNWVVNTPMEMGIAPPEKAKKALKTAEQFVNPFGVFVTGIDRDDSAGSDEGSFKGSSSFSYTGAVMTLPTSVQAIAENNYGNPDAALDYIKRMTRSFSFAFPGSMYEVSPDYGMISQAWNIYGFAIPIVQQFFGINPDAARKTVTVKPQMPKDWDDVALENVKIRDNAVSVFYTKTNNQIKLRVTQTQPDWTLKLILPKELDGKSFRNSSSSSQTTTDENNFILSGKGELELILEEE